MRGVLVDAGPLIAIFNDRDRHHAACRSALSSIRQPLVTVWPAVTEASHLLRSVAAQASLDLLAAISSGAFELAPLGNEAARRIGELMRKYADLPMDLTDAALVHVAERDDIRTILTLDRRDFSIYRPRHVKRFQLLP